MPEIGEKAKARDVGYKSRCIMIWSACSDCGKQRWVRSNAKKSWCISCGMKKGKVVRRKGPASPLWKGGSHQKVDGYIWVHARSDDPCEGMELHNGYISEHRLVMARKLGRPLQRNELVHHKNHRKDDNRIENLVLVNRSEHQRVSLREFTNLLERVTGR